MSFTQIYIAGLYTLCCLLQVEAGSICVSDDECNRAIGEVCWWAWDGCDTGECMCDPRTSYHDVSLHFCRPLKYGEERCEPGDKCLDGMTCTDGYCRCEQGTMTSDSMFCLQDHEKLLGQSCTQGNDYCFQKSVHDYIGTDLHCSGRCRCNDGFKQDGQSCVRWNIDETGCSQDHHCQGGALCLESVCQCPSRYKPVARNSKCAKIGARYDVRLGERCEEMSEQSYCAYGLVCHPCPRDKHHTCAKYKLPYHMSHGSNLHLSSICVHLITLFSCYSLL